eukprot:793308-Prymnesium_polylepis.1
MLADDVAIIEKMRLWTEEQAREYFESGGTVEPAVLPQSELAEEPSTERPSVWAGGEVSIGGNTLPRSMEGGAGADEDDVCSVCLEVYRSRVVT